MKIKSVLFVGRRNAARSVMAETCFNAAGIPGWRAFSAGWQTQNSIDTQAIRTLAANGFETDTLSSKPVAIFLQEGAPEIDLCVFLDEDLPPDVQNYPAARESWKIPDPSRETESTAFLSNGARCDHGANFDAGNFGETRHAACKGELKLPLGNQV